MIGDNKITIVCFYWIGEDQPGWTDTKLAKKYIRTLHDSIKRNTTYDFEFHCITTLKPFDKRITFHQFDCPSMKGCLPKFAAYNPAYGFKGRVFTLDLDVVINGSMDDLFSYDGYVCNVADFHQGRENCGGFISFNADKKRMWSRFWSHFNINIKRIEEESFLRVHRESLVYRRDKFFKGKVDLITNMFPGQIHNYVNQIAPTGILPENNRIVFFNGLPKPHMLPHVDWVRENWREGK